MPNKQELSNQRSPHLHVKVAHFPHLGSLLRVPSAAAWVAGRESDSS